MALIGEKGRYSRISISARSISSTRHASSAPLSLDVSGGEESSSLEEGSVDVGVRHRGVIATFTPSMSRRAPGSDDGSDAEDDSVVSLEDFSSGVDISVSMA